MPIDEARLHEVLRTHWGYQSFRPLQREVIEAVLGGHDSVVVLPTGGGKSLCYQAPAVMMPGMAIVVSPLISLMKDQVDGLRECGIPAAAIHSALAPEERQRIADDIRADRVKLLYVAPERLCTPRMLDFLRQRTISFVAIDEAHCISNWGHDFRPEYRMLGELRQRLPGIGMHGFTATATEQVRRDIAQQLQLKQTNYLVGDFDRPNLNYRVERRGRGNEQLQAVLVRHAGESGIIYCISRKEVDSLAQSLQSAGIKAAPYHAGLTDQTRHRNQDDFLNEQVDVVVATVAFGMGIDKSNVRFVVHMGAPKSLEAYQQETGRAGRDGLEAECLMLHGGNDFLIWRKLNSDLVGDAREQMEANLRGMESFCSAVTCRHRLLVEHFGQTYAPENCGACDVCLDQQEFIPDALVIGQKILSCVLRVNENFGGDYVAQVLVGSREARIIANGHDQLSTHGLLKEVSKTSVREWIEQLCGQNLLAREGEYRILKVTAEGREMLRGQRTPRLLASARTAPRESKAPKRQSNFSVGMDVGLFESLRVLRRRLASERNVPPFVVFGDVTLQDLSRRRPTTLESFRMAHGVGDHKVEQYGEAFIKEIAAYCAQHGLKTDQEVADDATELPSLEKRIGGSRNAARVASDEMFRQGCSLEEVMDKLGRARSTVTQYLVDFLSQDKITSPQPWVEIATQARVEAAAEVAGHERLTPIFEHLEQQVPYEQIRITLACLKNRRPDESPEAE